MRREKRRDVLILLDSSGQLAGRVGGHGPCGSFHPVVSCEDPGENLAGTVVSGLFRGKPIRVGLVIREVEVVRAPSPGGRDVQPLSALGTREASVLE